MSNAALPWQAHHGLIKAYQLIRLYGEQFARIISTLSFLGGIIAYAKEVGGGITIGDGNRHDVIKHLENLCAQLQELELDMSLSSARELLAAIKENKETEWEFLLRDLHRRIFEQLESVVVLTVPTAKKKYYESHCVLFRQTVLEKFPSIVREADEAAKCFALGRETACVFHLMRILEIGLQALAVALGVPHDKQNWENIINNIEAKIRAIGPAAGIDWKIDEQFYSAAAVQFRYFKNAWRNHVMHIRDSHNEESAREIMEHVRAFMRHLSERLTEQV